MRSFKLAWPFSSFSFNAAWPRVGITDVGTTIVCVCVGEGERGEGMSTGESAQCSTLGARERLRPHVRLKAIVEFSPDERQSMAL